MATSSRSKAACSDDQTDGSDLSIVCSESTFNDGSFSLIVVCILKSMVYRDISWYSREQYPTARLSPDASCFKPKWQRYRQGCPHAKCRLEGPSSVASLN